MPPYYLHHYFDPDFNHQNRAPSQTAGGNSNLAYLGYVQNVVQGQVLAEMIDIESAEDMAFLGLCPPELEQRFIFESPELPCGANVAPHPGNPRRLVAESNGYPFYYEGNIVVKKLLNIRSDIDFHTGNVMFVSDVMAHKGIKPGFALRANNVVVKGHVDCGTIKAMGNIVCEGGVQGAEGSIIRAGGNIHLNFCQKATLSAWGNVVISGNCIHSTIYSRGTVLIKGQMVGGEIYANNSVYVENLGHRMGATHIYMGYDPFEYMVLGEIEAKQTKTIQALQKYAMLAARDNAQTGKYARLAAVLQGKLKVERRKQLELWEKFKADEEREQRCRIIVPGRVEPGVEISIGQANLHVDQEYNNVEFRLKDDEIIIHKSTF